MSLIVEQLKVGPAENFVYIIYDSVNKDAALVDCGWEANFIIQKIISLNLKLTYILLTHHHFDHTQEVPIILNQFTCPVVIGKKEAEFYNVKFPNLVLVSENDKITLGQNQISVIETFGHTAGSICYYADNNLFTGDTLFIEGCGRCDLPGGNVKQMFKSLNKIKMNFAPHTIIWPGHDYGHVSHATLQDVMKFNTYLQYDNEKEFIKYRG